MALLTREDCSRKKTKKKEKNTHDAAGDDYFRPVVGRVLETRRFGTLAAPRALLIVQCASGRDARLQTQQISRSAAGSLVLGSGNDVRQRRQ